MRATLQGLGGLWLIAMSSVAACHRESVPPRPEGGSCIPPGAVEMGPCPPFEPKNVCSQGRHVDCVERRDDGSCWYAHSQPACQTGVDCKAPPPERVACP